MLCAKYMIYRKRRNCFRILMISSAGDHTTFSKKYWSRNQRRALRLFSPVFPEKRRYVMLVGGRPWSLVPGLTPFPDNPIYKLLCAFSRGTENDQSCSKLVLAKVNFPSLRAPRVPNWILTDFGTPGTKTQIFHVCFPLRSRQINLKLLYHLIHIAERMHHPTFIFTENFETSFRKNLPIGNLGALRRWIENVSEFRFFLIF